MQDIWLDLVRRHVTTYEPELAFVTEKVAFNMREVLKKCRKNYFGVFDSPIDQSTGREKIWFHLTKQFVDFAVKNIDLDTKDVQFVAKHDGAHGLNRIVRAIMRNKLDEARFGETIDLLLRKLAIDGTVVVSTDLDSKKRLRFTPVELLNFYIDPTSDSIASAPAVSERIVLSRSEFDRIGKSNSWRNMDIEGALNTEKSPGTPRHTLIPEVTVHRYRGFAELEGKEVSAEIICSETDGTWVFHHFEKRDDNSDKGYEEGWYTRVPGRWYGEGVAERLLQYQIAYNINANVRINRNIITQLGLWVFRKGSGINASTLSRLSANGLIPVNDVESDIKQIPVQDASPASYRDQEIIYSEAQRTTGAFDTAVGDSMPASTTATNAAIQSQASQTGFTLVREGFGMFIERLIQNRAMPLALSTIRAKDVIRMGCDEREFREIAEWHVHNTLYDQLSQINAAQLGIDPMQVEMARQSAIASYMQRGKQWFIDLLHTLDPSDYETDVTVTTEDMNIPVITANATTLIQSLAAMGLIEPALDLTRQAADLMGFDTSGMQMPMQPAMAPGYNDAAANPYNAAQSQNPEVNEGGNAITGVPPQGLDEVATAAKTFEPS